MGLVDQVKNKLNIGNHDDAPTNQGATSTTHHQTSARKSLSLFFSMLLHLVLLILLRNIKQGSHGALGGSISSILRRARLILLS